MLEISNLHYSYGEVATLRGVDLTVPTGCIVSVTGRNGVGKTTLMKAILGIHAPREGSILFKGEDVTRVPAHRRVTSGLGYVPQGRQIFPRLTVEENITIGLTSRGLARKKVLDDIYGFFPVLGEMRSRAGGNLSGGQQQQLAIGRALATEPELLVLDEPTEGIQPNIIQLIGKILQQLVAERGLTVLIVEQYLDFIREISTDFAIMNRGAVPASGPINELTQELVQQYLSV